MTGNFNKIGNPNKTKLRQTRYNILILFIKFYYFHSLVAGLSFISLSASVM